MRIAKLIRHLVPIAMAAIIALGLVGLHASTWIIVVETLLGYGVSDWIVNTTDLWLRRMTKDKLWLWGQEGKEWLRTDEGQEWKKKTGYKH